MKVIALVRDPQGIARVLRHLGLPTEEPSMAPAIHDQPLPSRVTEASAGTMTSSQLYQTFALCGLSRGQHTVQVKVVSGTLTVDNVGLVY